MQSSNTEIFDDGIASNISPISLHNWMEPNDSKLLTPSVPAEGVKSTAKSKANSRVKPEVPGASSKVARKKSQQLRAKEPNSGSEISSKKAGSGKSTPPKKVENGVQKAIHALNKEAQRPMVKVLETGAHKAAHMLNGVRSEIAQWNKRFQSTEDILETGTKSAIFASGIHSVFHQHPVELETENHAAQSGADPNFESVAIYTVSDFLPFIQEINWCCKLLEKEKQLAAINNISVDQIEGSSPKELLVRLRANRWQKNWSQLGDLSQKADDVIAKEIEDVKGVLIQLKTTSPAAEIQRIMIGMSRRGLITRGDKSAFIDLLRQLKFLEEKAWSRAELGKLFESIKRADESALNDSNSHERRKFKLGDMRKTLERVINNDIVKLTDIMLEKKAVIGKFRGFFESEKQRSDARLTASSAINTGFELGLETKAVSILLAKETELAVKSNIPAERIEGENSLETLLRLRTKRWEYNWSQIGDLSKRAECAIKKEIADLKGVLAQMETSTPFQDVQRILIAMSNKGLLIKGDKDSFIETVKALKIIDNKTWPLADLGKLFEYFSQADAAAFVVDCNPNPQAYAATVGAAHKAESDAQKTAKGILIQLDAPDVTQLKRNNVVKRAVKKLEFEFQT